MKEWFKSWSILLIVGLVWFSVEGGKFLYAQGASPGVQGTNPPAAPAPPPSKAPQLSASDLDKLVAPIALYPDPLIATVLPASAYPLEVVQAARFVKDTNNIAKLDSQPWDENVKAVARLPQVISQMDANIGWTSDLGDAFINQPKELMDAVQRMRARAQESGALKTTPQQTVSTTETIVTNMVEQYPVYVTNEVVQIQPSDPQVIYVPEYNPTVVYAGYPVAYPGYYYPPAPYYGYGYGYYPGALAASALVGFGVGVAMSGWFHNDCDWGHGNVHVEHHADINRNVNRNVNRDVNRTGNRGGQWQPDQNRLNRSGSTRSTAQNRDARGWGSRQGGTGAARTGAGTARAGAGAGTARAGTANRPAQRQSGAFAGQNRATTPSGNRQLSQTGNRTQTRQTPSTANRAQTRQTTPSANRRTTSSGSAFNNSSGASRTRQSSNRGYTSRGYSGGGGGGGGGRSYGGGGGGRGGGGGGGGRGGGGRGGGGRR
jgi:hypothetical protein